MSKTIVRTFLIAVAATALLAGCSKKDDNKTPAKANKTPPATKTPAAKTPAAKTPTPPAKPAAADPVAAAKSMFKARCTVCHGNSGKGDGIGAKSLKPKPRDYSDAKWQKSVTDAQIAAIIVKGGAATGKAATMPPNPDLAAKPKVVAEMVKLIRAFAK